MFEKSLYDLIRGVRANKGNERQYVLESLNECRKEVKSQDLDMKASAILKLIYLDMFGHEMAWASFHALEVMSSSKFRQKRLGYLAAVQSFRLETDVLMLTTNLIKKDLCSPSIPEISLSINGLSHIVSPSLARDLTPDLVLKLSHSSPHIRKKAVLVLYKCFLQSPELLRTSWPRLRECLGDPDTSVVSATVNVVCELARRNPKNYLPLAPQLFRLLTDGGNNWTTIKLIKLFATLTPLEPRLVKKLIVPITNLISTTPAMSLLYECINGLISGGVLAEIQHTKEGEELTLVCATKLRGFLVEGDSNLKYVALLALKKLAHAHAHLVDAHQDVILECIDDEDLSIRYRALELVVGIVTSESLHSVVARLMCQLKSSKLDVHFDFVDSSFETEPEDADLRPVKANSVNMGMNLPEGYKLVIIKTIIDICSRNMYASVTDFRWYLDVLVRLVRYAPPACKTDQEAGDFGSEWDDIDGFHIEEDVGEHIGKQLRNVAVRVRSVRPDAVSCAQILLSRREDLFPTAGRGGFGVLSACAWIAGEYSSLLPNPLLTFDYLTSPNSKSLPSATLSIYIHSISKVYASLCISLQLGWTPERKSSFTLLTDRVLHFLEPLTKSPCMEVQERAVEFFEIFRLAGEAISAQPVLEDNDYDPPLILTQAIPSLFIGQELNPVAPKAQRKVPLPPELDLNTPINTNCCLHLDESYAVETLARFQDLDDQDFREFYYKRSSDTYNQRSSTVALLSSSGSGLPSSYQGHKNIHNQDTDSVARKQKERQERNRDDPFYIFTPTVAGTIPGHEIDLIPVLELKLEDISSPMASVLPSKNRREYRKVEISADETIEGIGDLSVSQKSEAISTKRKYKKGILQVDASGLVGYSLKEGEQDFVSNSHSMPEFDKLRLEMRNAAERIAIQNQSIGSRKKRDKKRLNTKYSLSAGTGDEHSQAHSIPRDRTSNKKKGRKKVSNQV